MKKMYEKRGFIYFSILILFIVEILFIVFLIKKKIIIYEKFSGVVVKKNMVVFVLNDDELKLFYKNKKIYIDGEVCYFQFNKVIEDILKRDGVIYHQLFIEYDMGDELKENDVVNVTIAKENRSVLNIFRVILEGD